jgi:hypothetical protein
MVTVSPPVASGPPFSVPPGGLVSSSTFGCDVECTRSMLSMMRSSADSLVIRTSSKLSRKKNVPQKCPLVTALDSWVIFPSPVLVALASKTTSPS